ncbi:general secretion pathway protein GspA [Seongchinamella sediminis]|uniref:General secretion pathway protein GspA n=1 Tax=Seongchinamella sediminis TaxID=2283635 RepID=A0A3L7DYH2_9GAMM|nr:general secretion pathway protein GspA [Seongchinamella sediminis]
MYHHYFGLNEAPFSIAVNPRYLFMSARHRDALAHLLYGVGAGGGFILLTGEVGTGKTTINRCLLEQLPHDTDIAIILNPALNAVELLATACDELGIGYDDDRQTLKSLTDALHSFLLDNHTRGRKTVLMIDEAQHLDFEVLEQIRLLTNLETNSEKLLQIILIGQPELAQLLARPELRQLNQRITARYNLGPLNRAETGAYINHRLQVAGMAADRVIFPPSVVRGIYQRTRGIPRLINVLCDRIMLGAYGRNKHRADRATLRLAAREVLGEEGVKQVSWWPWALAALVVMGALAAWWGMQSNPPGRDADAIAGDVPAIVAPAATEIEAETPAPETAAAAMIADAGSAVPDSALASWLLAPGDATALYWSLFSDRPLPDRWCQEPNGELACVEDEAMTWDELVTLSRPLLLDMVSPERFAAGVVLLGIEGRQAWVGGESAVELVALADLGPLWTGRYRFLWRPPVGFDRPLSAGDSGPAVAAVAQLFAQLDGQAQALAGQRFNDSLKQRVMIFQRDMGLEADGVVGVQTLLKLNRELGIDISAAAARAVLQARAGAN